MANFGQEIDTYKLLLQNTWDLHPICYMLNRSFVVCAFIKHIRNSNQSIDGQALSFRLKGQAKGKFWTKILPLFKYMDLFQTNMRSIIHVKCKAYQTILLRSKQRYKLPQTHIANKLCMQNEYQIKFVNCLFNTLLQDTNHSQK